MTTRTKQIMIPKMIKPIKTDGHRKIFQRVLKEAISKLESKEKEDEDKKIAEMPRKKYLKKYSDVFKKKWGKGDTIRCNPVKIETKTDRNIKPINCRTPIPVQLHSEKQQTRKSKTS